MTIGNAGDVPPAGAEDATIQDQVAAEDKLDEVEDESFPASDPHSDWAGH